MYEQECYLYSSGSGVCHLLLVCVNTAAESKNILLLQVPKGGEVNHFFCASFQSLCSRLIQKLQVTTADLKSNHFQLVAYSQHKTRPPSLHSFSAIAGYHAVRRIKRICALVTQTQKVFPTHFIKPKTCSKTPTETAMMCHKARA